VQFADEVVWTTPNGNGSFDDANSINPTYFPDAQDYESGCIVLLVLALPVEACTFMAEDMLALCFIEKPDVDAGEDAIICNDEAYVLDATAQNYLSILWTSSGDGTFSNAYIKNPQYTPGQTDVEMGEVTLTLSANPINPCMEIVEDDMVLSVMACQQIVIPQGWSGISSNVAPDSPELELMFETMADELIVLQSMEDTWWPAQNINTIGDWDRNDGYQIKLTEEVELTVFGTMPANLTLELQAGWNLLPVLSMCPVDVAQLFDESGVLMVKEVAGWKLFWPELGINNLEMLYPGKSYFVLMDAPKVIIFPECSSLKTGYLLDNSELFDGFEIPDQWTDFVRTANSHTIAIPRNVGLDQGFEIGDVIAGIDSKGSCFGYTVWTGENINLCLFGDDASTFVKDGFDEGEYVSFVK
jgi:hypothetical protein